MIALLLLASVAPPVVEPLPPGVIAQLGSDRTRHGPSISEVAVSPDGRLVATAGVGRAIAVWDARDRTLLWEETFGDYPVSHRVRFSPDGRWLAVTGLFRPRICSTTPFRVATLLPPVASSLGVEFLPDGNVVASTDATSLSFWDPRTAQAVGDRVEIGETISHLRVSQATGLILVSTPRGNLLAFDGRKRAKRWAVSGHTGPLVDLELDPDGRTVWTVGRDGSVRRWSLGTGQAVALVRRGTPGPQRLLAHPKGWIVTYADHRIEQWDTTGKVVRRGTLPATRVPCYALTPDGQTLFRGGVPGLLERWNLSTFSFPATTLPVASIRGLQQDGTTWRILDVGGQVLEWSPGQAPRLCATLPEWSRRPKPDAFSPAGNLLAVVASGERTVECLDPRTGKRLHRLEVGPDTVQGLAFSASGQQLAVVTSRAEVRIWETAEGKPLRRFPLNVDMENLLWTLAFHDGDRRLAVGNEAGGLALCDPQTGKVLRTGQLPHRVSQLVALPHQPQLLFSGGQGNPLLYRMDARTGNVITQTDPEDVGLYRLALSPDGRWLATGGDFRSGKVTLWEQRTRQRVHTFPTHRAGVGALAFSADGRTLATGGDDGLVRICSLPSAPPLPLSRCWDGLRQEEAAEAFRAVSGLTARPTEASALLARRLRPALAIEPESLTPYLDDLSSSDFTVRQRAEQRLEALGPSVVSVLRKLAESQSLEPRRRLERLITAMQEGSEALRTDRALFALEQMGDAGRPLLYRLAEGVPEAEITQMARAALKRRR